MRATAAAQSTHEPLAVAAPRRREVARRVCARVEVLVEPAVGRYEETPLDPVNALLRLRGRVRILQRAFPHQSVAATVEHDDVRAGAVAVRLLVGAGLELGDVCLHRVVG